MIEITSLEQERQFAEFTRRRSEVRDSLRFGVFPNLVQSLRLHAAFVADYGPGGQHYDPALWQYYLSNIQPIAAQQAEMIAAANFIVGIMQAVEQAAPGTFGIEAPMPSLAPEPDDESPELP